MIGNGSEGLSVDEGGIGDSGADLFVHVESGDGGRLFCSLGRGLVEVFRLAESEMGQLRQAHAHRSWTYSKLLP